MNKKNLMGIAGVVLTLVAGVLVYKSLTMQQPLGSATEGPIIVGGLVSIDSSTITVKAADGTEMKFAASSKTPVYSQVKEGEVGRAYEQLSIGDVLAITADNNGAKAQKIEIVPVGQPPLVLMGTLVSVAASSLVVRPPAPDLALAATLVDVTVEIHEGTKVLTRVLGAQVGRALHEIAPGAQVSVWGALGEQGVEADTILLSPPR